jgi:hypothetical protein
VSYPQQGGYPQQPYQQQPQPAFAGGGTNPFTAVLAALLALAVAGFEIVVLVRVFDVLNFSTLGDQPVEVPVILGVQAAAALFLVLGAMFTFARKMAGTVLIVIGSILAIAGFFLPALLYKIDIGQYLELTFTFGGSSQTFQALTLIVSPLALLVSVLPPTLNHLRGGRDDYDPYSGGPGSGGFQQPDFPNIPGFQSPQMPHVPGLQTPQIPNVPGFQTPQIPNIPNVPRPPQMPNW